MRLLLILLFPALLFSQDFRKMSFGQTTEELKETYPEADFTFEPENIVISEEHIFEPENIVISEEHISKI